MEEIVVKKYVWIGICYIHKYERIQRNCFLFSNLYQTTFTKCHDNNFFFLMFYRAYAL